MEIHALRLRPQEDLKLALQTFVQQQNLQAGCILSTVGSLSRLALRFADQDTPTIRDGRFEILSLAGTLSPQGNHLHLAIADAQGQCLGGHLLEGCLIYTTAELVLAELSSYRFRRLPDPQTGFRELSIEAG
jgi:predicted DNA-binding protein with PD1-like motif